MNRISFGLAGKIAGFASAVIAGVVGNLVFDYALHRDFFHPFRVERRVPPAATAVRIPAVPGTTHVTAVGLSLPQPVPPTLPAAVSLPKPEPSALPIAVDTPPAAPPALPHPAISAKPAAAETPPAPAVADAEPSPPAAAAAAPFVADLPTLRLPDRRPPPPPRPGPGNGGLY